MTDNERPAMQAVMFMPHTWEVLLTTEQARARAVRHIRSRVERASGELAAAHLELAEFHRKHCPDKPVAACAVCMGRL